MRHRLFLLLLSLVLLLQMACSPGNLSPEEKVKIAQEVLRDDSLSAMLSKAEEADRAGDSTNSKCSRIPRGISGTPIRWGTGIAYAQGHLPDNNSLITPVYVEYAVGTFDSTLIELMDSLGLLQNKHKAIANMIVQLFDNEFYQVVCRAYFVQDSQYPGYRSLVFVPAFKRTNETVFTEYPESSIYDVGSACPPDCQSGRPLTPDSGDPTGARFAREAFPDPTLIPCLQHGAGGTQDCN